MHDRSAWERGESGPQSIKGKTYKQLTEFKRPCTTCGEKFSIFVTEKIASGAADSNSFALKNCERHRRNKTYADMGMTPDEMEELKKTNDGLFETVQQLRRAHEATFQELQVVKAKLARYELQPAMEALGGAPARMPWES